MNCSENTELVVKMNYHKGWVAYCNDEVLPLIRNDEGFMNVFVPFQGDAKVTLQYGSTNIDHIALGITIAAILVGFFFFLRKSLRSLTAAKFFIFRRKINKIQCLNQKQRSAE
jgi:uncharacterized membrane protein YfhO